MFLKLEGRWPRQEHFRHYMDNMRCTYSLTVQVDITALRRELRARGLRAYPVQIYMLAATVNRFPAFRMGMTEAGEPGYWDVLHPSYTVLHPQAETFSSIWTPYRADCAAFYSDCVRDADRCAPSGELAPQPDMPANVFHISSVPWIDFSSFNLNVYGEGTHLLPIFTIGRYVEQNGRCLLPLALQLHHAACDGFHAGQFLEALRAMAADCPAWLPPRMDANR